MRKIKYIFILLVLLCSCSSCKEERKEEVVEKQEVTIISKNEDSTIKEGSIEGFTFKETNEETNRIKIEMENGDIILIVLSNQSTPITIANFKSLVSDYFYDGLIFHRVIKDFVIQTGDPTGTGYYAAEQNIKGEFSSNGVNNSLSHTRGVVSMARSNDPDSASSQFFIVHENATDLDGKYASFGKVFAGMDAVDRIANTKTDDYDKPIEEQKIKTVRFIELTTAE